LNPGAERLRWARDALRIHCPHACGDVFADGHDSINRIPLHRLFLVPRGSPADGGRVEDTTARVSLPLPPGSVLLLPADRSYRFVFARGLQLVGFHFRIEVVPGHDVLGAAVRWQRTADPAAADAAWGASRGRGLADWLAMEAVLRSQLARLVEVPWDAVERAANAQRRWGAAMSELERLGARRAVAACAARQKLTREGFSRAFRRDLGVSPSAWLSQRLADRASEILRYTDRTLDDIATELGFADGFAVSRLLKRVTGRRPTELRGRQAKSGP
jgi:AraC-like DNA-binding protein